MTLYYLLLSVLGVIGNLVFFVVKWAVLLAVAWPFVALWYSFKHNFFNRQSLCWLWLGLALFGAGFTHAYFRDLPTDYLSQLGWRNIAYMKPDVPAQTGDNLVEIAIGDYHGPDEYSRLSPMVHYNLVLAIKMDNFYLFKVLCYDPVPDDEIGGILARVAYLFTHVTSTAMSFFEVVIYSLFLSVYRYACPWLFLVVASLLRLLATQASSETRSSKALSTTILVGAILAIPAFWSVQYLRDSKTVKSVEAALRRGDVPAAVSSLRKADEWYPTTGPVHRFALSKVCDATAKGLVQGAVKARCLPGPVAKLKSWPKTCGKVPTSTIIEAMEVLRDAKYSDVCESSPAEKRAASEVLLGAFPFGMFKSSSPGNQELAKGILQRYGGRLGAIGLKETTFPPPEETLVILISNYGVRLRSFDWDPGTSVLSMGIEYFIRGLVDFRMNLPCTLGLSYKKKVDEVTKPDVIGRSETCNQRNASLVHLAQKKGLREDSTSFVYEFSLKKPFDISHAYRLCLQPAWKECFDIVFYDLAYLGTLAKAK